MELNRTTLTKTEKNWAMACHLSSFAGCFIPFGGVLGPLICWLAHKDESDLININGRNSLNFQLSMLLYMLLMFPLCFIIVGIPIEIALGIFETVCVIVASIKTANDELFRYPLAIPFIQN